MSMPWYILTGTYVAMLIISMVCFAIADYAWGEEILTDFDALLGQGLVLEGLGKVWFIFLWGGGLTLLVALFLKRPISNLPRGEQAAKGLWLSLNAGIFEELIYRAFVFLACMPLLVFMNFILFGFVEWLNVEILLPLANFATFGALEPQLLSENWVYGAAIIFAVGLFRDEHKYLGYFGWVNSWFLGMVMFFLVFNYGLLTAIAAHVIYDAIIFSIRAMTSEQENSLSVLVRNMLNT